MSFIIILCLFSIIHVRYALLPVDSSTCNYHHWCSVLVHPVHHPYDLRMVSDICAFCCNESNRLKGITISGVISLRFSGTIIITFPLVLPIFEFFMNPRSFAYYCSVRSNHSPILHYLRQIFQSK